MSKKRKEPGDGREMGKMTLESFRGAPFETQTAYILGVVQNKKTTYNWMFCVSNWQPQSCTTQRVEVLGILFEVGIHAH